MHTAIRMQQPGWVFRGAAVDLDFANQRYYGGYLGLESQDSSSARMKSLISGGGNSTANSLYAPDSTGLLHTFPADANRLTSGMGLWCETTGNTNYVAWARNLTQTGWVLGGSMAVTATSIAGADGKTSGASRITAGANNDTITFAITQTSATFTSSCYFKRHAGTSEIDMSTNGGSTWVRVDNQTGVNSSTFTLVQIPALTMANPSISFRITNATDSADIDFVQCTNAIDGVTAAATPITTAGASLTRAGCACFLNNPSVNFGFNDGARICNDFLWQRPVSGLAYVSGNGATNSLIFGMDEGVLVTGGCDGGPISLSSSTNTHGTTLVSSNNGNFGLGNLNKIGFSFGANQSFIVLNGVATIGNSTHFPTTSFLNTHGGWGSHNNSTVSSASVNGVFSRVALFPHEGQLGDFMRWCS